MHDDVHRIGLFVKATNSPVLHLEVETAFDETTWESYLPTNSELHNKTIQKLFMFDDLLLIIGIF